VEVIQRAAQGWHSDLRDLLQSAKDDVLICSPFVGQRATTFVAEGLPPGFSDHGRLTILTNLSVGNVCQLATDPRALQALVGTLSRTAIYHVPGLHAKAYIADDARAIVTSGNLTSGGLFRNLEYGVVISDRQLVRTIRSDLSDFSQLGATVPVETLTDYCNALDAVLPSIKAERQLDSVRLRQRFRESLQPIEDDLLRLRLAGGAVHTVFAQTILYLLRTHRAMTTVQLHPMIAAIHPDLCDDSIDRVIDGEHFGKKWKHAVRTAQQQLKKQGELEYVDGVWRLPSI
jgi:hypothetical protein